MHGCSLLFAVTASHYLAACLMTATGDARLVSGDTRGGGHASEALAVTLIGVDPLAETQALRLLDAQTDCGRPASSKRSSANTLVLYFYTNRAAAKAASISSFVLPTNEVIHVRRGSTSSLGGVWRSTGAYSLSARGLAVARRNPADRCGKEGNDHGTYAKMTFISHGLPWLAHLARFLPSSLQIGRCVDVGLPEPIPLELIQG